jgi:hypothetical protein
VHSSVGGFSGCAVFVSFNGGATWSPPKKLDCGKGFGDPWLAFGSKGDVFLVGLDDPSNALVWRSSDGGLTWSDPSRLPGTAFDHPSIVVDRTDSSSNGTIYVLAAQAIRDKAGRVLNPVGIARSTNWGQPFEQPVHVMPTNLRHQAGVPVVLRDGTVAFSFMDF